jgi:anthranilate phosphoribosyltransferase
VLAALGINFDGTPDQAKQNLERAGLAFCFAPRFHPALAHVAQVRRRLGVPTIFNCMGPLANPAGAKRQLLGVGRRELLDVMAGALMRLGTTRAFVVCGSDKLDEVSLAAPTHVREVCGRDIKAIEWTVSTFGLEPVTLADLTVGDAQQSALLIERVLAGEDGPALRVVLANAAAALLLCDKVATLADGVSVAKEAIESGQARSVLEKLRTPVG